MTKTYYAVCDVNGPISITLEAATLREAYRELERLAESGDLRQAIDDACTDAEDDLDIAGEGMASQEFSAALEAAGCVYEGDSDEWSIWSCPSRRYFVVAAPGHYGDRDRVYSSHATLAAAKLAAGTGYVVRVGDKRKGDEWLRAYEQTYPEAHS